MRLYNSDGFTFMAFEHILPMLRRKLESLCVLPKGEKVKFRVVYM